MDKKQLTIFSIIVSILFTIWTFCLPLWNTTDWFINKTIHRSWFLFDIIMIPLFFTLTYLVIKEKKQAHFISPMMLGMIYADWILNTGLWIIYGYNMLELRFILAIIFIITTTLLFTYYFNEIYKSSKEWK